MTNPYQSPVHDSSNSPEKEEKNIYGTVGCCLSVIPFLLSMFAKAEHILISQRSSDILELVSAIVWLAGLFCSFRGMAFVPYRLALVGLVLSVIYLLSTMIIAF